MTLVGGSTENVKAVVLVQLEGRTEQEEKKIESIFADFLAEFFAAEKKHPKWPKDAVRAVSILSEEAGEAVQAVNSYEDEGGALEAVRHEIRQTGAMAIRSLLHM
ncbi:MAG: hypothetical protein WC489_08455 [Patescibacteria group bacterium]|jgi:NTP pyrophosphatase (non-canonical NTP hydrolase)